MSKVGDIKGLSANIITALNYNYTKRKNIARLSIKNVKKKYLTEFMCETTIKIYKDVLIRILYSNSQCIQRFIFHIYVYG